MTSNVQKGLELLSPQLPSILKNINAQNKPAESLASKVSEGGLASGIQATSAVYNTKIHCITVVGELKIIKNSESMTS